METGSVLYTAAVKLNKSYHILSYKTVLSFLFKIFKIKGIKMELGVTADCNLILSTILYMWQYAVCG